MCGGDFKGGIVQFVFGFKRQMKVKKIGVAVLVSLVSVYVWHVHFNYRFEEITAGKVYKSALIPADKIGSYLEKYQIKTVVNLLDPGVQDALNPAAQKEISDEDSAIKRYNQLHNKKVQHVSIPSPQVPTKKTLTAFYKVLDDEKNYPVLIHCYHGTGRAPLYSGIYRMEYENWRNSDARDKTRVVIEALGYRSSFADGRSKGDFVMSYQPRNTQ